MINFARRILNTLWPRGAFWEPKTDGDYDKLLEGVAENSGVVRTFLSGLANIRNPLLTPVLSDLEKELGIIPATGATVAQRRARAKAFIERRASTGAWDVLQAQLRSAGFDDVYVHPNDPAVDPAVFLAQAFNMTCNGLLPGGNDPECGEPEAICALIGGQLLVNGDLFSNLPNYINECDEPGVECDDGIFCGDFDGYRRTNLEDVYEVPTISGYWPLIFFVGGAATRDPVTNALTEINIYQVPQQRRSEFRRIILRFKPLHSWAGLIVIYN
jgi:hypothetical protein